MAHSYNQLMLPLWSFVILTMSMSPIFKKMNKDRDTDESQESYLWLYLELVIRITECVKTWDENVNFVFNC